MTTKEINEKAKEVFQQLIDAEILFYCARKAIKNSKVQFIFHGTHIKAAEKIFPKLLIIKQHQVSCFDVGFIDIE